MKLPLSADDLMNGLLSMAARESVCILDSGGVGYLGSHLLIAGVQPAEVVELPHVDPAVTLAILDEKLSGDRAAVFTISYDFGRKLLNIPGHEVSPSVEPDVFLALFDALVIHDYRTGETRIVGKEDTFPEIERKLRQHKAVETTTAGPLIVESDLTKDEYLAAVEAIKERIRCGDTYQTNLTQQLTAELPATLTPAAIFKRLRLAHPAAFAAFVARPRSTVVSASPERFFRIDGDRISTSPIKGTRPRGHTVEEDAALKNELLASEKDRAENTMIVDLLRNDIGRVCEFGSVRVEKLCDIERHPTFFHLVSTVTGTLRPDTKFSDVLRAVFPCGSITGAPKISTIRIIDEIEPSSRGLSMGAIGYYAPPHFGLPATFDLSVAIRTMVIRDQVATFNVGGGITIDSDPTAEYEESLVKAQALLRAINGTIST
jgi:para-aminobenzoate synthetase component 1